MSNRLRLTNDPYVRTLERRSKMALEWFDAIATALWEDLEEFKEQEAKNPGPSFALGAMQLQINGDLPSAADEATPRCRSELTLSTRCSKVRVVANDPTGWIYLEVQKNSPIFSGTLHRGAIEVVLLPHSSTDIHFVECDWLNADGSDFPKNGEAIADKLWDVLFLPKIRHQLVAVAKGLGH